MSKSQLKPVLDRDIFLEVARVNEVHSGVVMGVLILVMRPDSEEMWWELQRENGIHRKGILVKDSARKYIIYIGIEWYFYLFFRYIGN